MSFRSVNILDGSIKCCSKGKHKIFAQAFLRLAIPLFVLNNVLFGTRLGALLEVFFMEFIEFITNLGFLERHV